MTDSTATPTDATQDSTPLVTERDMLGALEILQGGSEDAPVFFELTDEELLGLAGTEGLALLGSPFLDRDGVDQRTAATVALRSLTARHLISRPDDEREPEGAVLAGEGDPSERTVQLGRQLAGIITLRRVSEGLIVSSRTLNGGTTVLAHHLFPGGGVLEEYVTTDGYHHFSVPALGALPERIATFADPFEDASEDSEPEEVPAGATDESLGLIGARALTGITVAHEEGGYQATVVAVEGHVRVIDNGPIEDARPEGEAGLVGATIGDVSAESLRGMITALIPVAEDADVLPEKTDSEAESSADQTQDAE